MQISQTESTQPGQGIAFARRQRAHWHLLWHGLFYLELVAATIITLLLKSLSWGGLALLLSLTLLLGFWYGICIVVPSLFWRRHPLITQGYLVCIWGLWFVLAYSHAVYWFILFGLCSQVYQLSSRLWKLPGILILATLSLWQLVVGLRMDYGVLLIFFSLVLVGFPIALHLETVSQQNREKDRLLQELEATRKELAVASRHAGAMQERQRLAHEIHDTLAQGFTSILMHVEAARGAHPDNMPMVSRHLDHIQQAARENLAEARRLMWALQPEAFERTSLPEVLTHLSEKWSAENGISASTTITGPVCTLRPEIEVTLLRTAQEGLANARKHARASQVTVILSYMDDMVMLDVQDDGVGFEPTQLPASPGIYTNGFGLKALRVRAEQLGGMLTIESTPGEGTTLAIALPALAVSSGELQDGSEAGKELAQ